MGLTQKPCLRTSIPCQNMLWQGLLSLQNDFWVTLIEITSLHLQESHQECIWEDEFLFAKGEFDVDKLLLLVDFDNCSLAEFLVECLMASPYF